MFLAKRLKSIILLSAGLFYGMTSYGQIIGGNAYIIGDLVNIAIDGAKGKEGTAAGGGFHYRGGALGTPCGFVSDPGDTGWNPLLHDGDFFTPGSPENGFGIEIDGINYNNNASAGDYDIVQHPTFPKYSEDGDCITVEWEGEAAGVTVNIKYHLVKHDLFYTTEITLINESGADLTDVYYYRNVDPDNNQSLSGSFVTTNTIVSQASPDCQKSLVSAEQFDPHECYLGFGALGDNFRVSHGGFSNRSGSDIWNGVLGLTGVIGAVEVADQAISLAYKTDIADNDTVNFTFAIVLSEDAVEGAFSSLYYIDYTSAGEVGGGVISQCNPVIDTAKSCQGNPVTLTVDGPNSDDYAWTWTSDPFDPGMETDGPTIVVTPSETTTYIVTGEPISDCLDNTITKTIVVEFSEGPEISITDPGAYCEEFDINDLVFEDINGIDNTVTHFFTEMPDSAKQTEPIFTGPLMGPDDEVWLMIGDTVDGCFDAVRLEIDFGGIGSAGDDSAIALCGIPGIFLDLHDLISEGANPLGDFEEETMSGQFNEGTGVLNVGGLAGTYVFTYTVEGVGLCPDDEATFTVEVYPQPIAKFEYEVDGISSADGLGSVCSFTEIDFVNGSTIPVGDIDTYDWDFGDGTVSGIVNPFHTYSEVGTYTITLTVTTDDGCTSTTTKEIIIYTEPILSVIFNSPTCFGFTDGSITAFVEGGSGTFDIEIKDSEDVIKNIAGSNTANSLGSGTYFITVTDGSGCIANATVILTDPPALDAFFRIFQPPCYGDLGYVVIDAVTGEGINNPMSYFWAPLADVPNGPEADSVNIPGGDYVLTINDSKGCSNTIDITMDQPDSLYFIKTRYDPAYCRLYGYQNGNGQVYAAATGGTGEPHYLWTEVATGNATTNSTWGGRNPGWFVITATDDNGCVITRSILVDSLNPIADFTVTSAQLNTDLKGTAPVSVEFVNTSMYFANPLNPLADTTFFWSLDATNSEWYLSNDYFEILDTTYEEKGVSYTVDVCLVAINKNGCRDTACKVLTIFEPIRLTEVNVFTPNGDGNNDVFTFSFLSASINTFECIIVNRWGVKVGEINHIDDGWDGTDMNGTPCIDGVYFYTYSATADNDEKLEGQGKVHLMGTKK